MFLNRGGSPVAAEEVKLSGSELSFRVGTAQNRPTVTLQASGKTVSGTVGTTKVTGERPPVWGACDANAKHTFGKPVVLFDGKSMDAWGVQNKDKAMMWSVVDGAMTNESHGNNLVSKEKFKDFRLDAEYKLSPKGNSGIYLRGRYEMQVLDDAGSTEDREHGHMSIYSAKAPMVNASKPAGEWQTVQITIVGNCVSATLNGQKIHDNSKLTRITGGALDAKETEPGPIMIQAITRWCGSEARDHADHRRRERIEDPVASQIAVRSPLRSFPLIGSGPRTTSGEPGLLWRDIQAIHRRCRRRQTKASSDHASSVRVRDSARPACGEQH